MGIDTELALQRSLGNVEGKLDGLIKAVEDMHGTTVKRLDDHGRRVAALERWRTFIAGGLVVVGYALKSFFGGK